LQNKQKIDDFVSACYQKFLEGHKTLEIILQEQSAKSLEYLIDLSESEILLPPDRFILSYQSKKYDIKEAMKDLRENKNNEKVLNEFKLFIKERVAYYTRKIAKDFPLDPKYLTIDTAHEKVFKEHMKSISGFLFQMAILFFSEKDYLEDTHLGRSFYNHLSVHTRACSFLSILKASITHSDYEYIATVIEEAQATRKRPFYGSETTANQDHPQYEPPAKYRRIDESPSMVDFLSKVSVTNTKAPAFVNSTLNAEPTTPPPHP
jgi:hypothetical protein